MKYIYACFLYLLAFNSSIKSQSIDSLSIYFNVDKAVITTKSAGSLDSFFSIKSKQAIAMEVSLSGYCDTTGSDTYNLDLSYRRAYAAQTYITQYKIQHLAFNEVKGFGKTSVTEIRNSDYNALLNRCVKIIVTHIDSAPPKLMKADTPFQEKSISSIIADTAVKVGNNITLSNLNFYGNNHHPMPRSIPLLQEILKAFQSNPKLKVEIQGFICCREDGTEAADSETGVYDLSLQRAKYVYDFLVRNKIDPSRLSYKGLGATSTYFPIELNRRVEFKILGK